MVLERLSVHRLQQRRSASRTPGTAGSDRTKRAALLATVRLAEEPTKQLRHRADGGRGEVRSGAVHPYAVQIEIPIEKLDQGQLSALSGQPSH